MRIQRLALLLGLGVLCLVVQFPAGAPACAAGASGEVAPRGVSQPITISAPDEAMAGETVELQARLGGNPVAGVEFRVAAPTQTLGVVTAASLNVRTGPDTSYPVRGIAYRGDILLILSTTPTGWCEVVMPSGGSGYSACEFLEQRPYGQPLGRTDEQGRLLTDALAVVPSEIEIRALVDGREAGSATIRIVPYEYDLAEDVVPGVTYRERRFVREADGPFTMEILEVDPANTAVSILPVHANDRAITRERVSAMAQRYSATAGVNGGYFVVTGTYAGASAGVYMLHREVVSGGRGRTALLFCEASGTGAPTALDVVDFGGRVTASDGATFDVFGVNRQRSEQDLVVYRPILGPRTLTDSTGVEVILDAQHRVVRVEDRAGSAEIPRDGEVVSGTGAAATWLRQHATVGTTLAVNVNLVPQTPPEVSGCTPEHIVGGGPRLVREGAVHVTQEGFGHENARHPRTAFGVTRRDTFLFVTLDGRQSRSAGMKLDELAAELVELGAVEAMNFDGGGSTTMVVNGEVRNSPSDGSERPVSDGILIFRGAPEFQKASAAIRARPTSPTFH